MPGKSRSTPLTQLRERNAVGQATAYVYDPGGPWWLAHLQGDKTSQISRMHSLPDLMSAAVKSDVLQRVPVAIRMDPERKNALIRFPELTRPRKNSTAVDMHG